MMEPSNTSRNSSHVTAKTFLEPLDINTITPRRKRSADLDTMSLPKPKRARNEKGAEEELSKARPNKAAKREPTKIALNETPSQRLDVYVFGSGESGELGLGHLKRNGKLPTNVKRPRLNDLLDAKTMGIVQLDVGGMHTIALTYDNKIITWGVNDQGALGRDTNWNAPTKDADADSDSSEDDDEDSGLNPKESTPTATPGRSFPAGTKFVQVAASDSASFALTEDGQVYGWGTFRGAEGIVGFTKAETAAGNKVQRTPLLIHQLEGITSIAAGGNHAQALDKRGNVFIWGTGGQFQLGREVMEKYQLKALDPQQFGLPRNQIKNIACGSYHNFAVHKNGRVYAWGLNNFGQTGVAKGAGEGNAVIRRPTIIKSLTGHRIADIQGGNHHSIACTEDGTVLTWGRCDDGQAGISVEQIPETDKIFDDRGKPRILTKPSAVPSIHAISVAAGIDDSIALTENGEAYSWGFSAGYRTGQGTEDVIEKATKIENSAVKGKKLTFAGCGGQFTVLAGPAEGF
ncbi:RCC1/BLIP-II [Stipitochalara longipes BDJ]|nr:RCC1/BLIP-II [Stipitochalara longipes BDJ]